MKHIIRLAAIAVFALFSVVGQTPLATAAGVPDSTIISHLHSKLAGHHAAYHGVDACSKDGVVKLHGTVKSEELKNHATDLAKEVKGVTEVQNDIVVKP